MIKLLIMLLSIINFFSKEDKPFLILNATAVLGNGEKIDNSALAFENGKFILVADATSIKLNLQWYNVLSGEGKYAYPLDMVRDKLDELKGLDENFPCQMSVIKEGGEASFALLSAPKDQGGKVEALFLKGRKLEIP